MRTIRVLAIVFISASLVLAALIDRADRSVPDLGAGPESSVAFASTNGATWYCPGGSDSAGRARVGVEVINTGLDSVDVVLTAFSSGEFTEPVEHSMEVDPRSRSVVALETLTPGDPWVGAVVEVRDEGVIVGQLFDGPTGTDRLPCLTRTSESWVVPSGATRVESDGETMAILLLNPFPDDAVLNIDFDADVGLDSMSGVVAPAHRLTVIEVTDQVTVAARVSALIDVVSGRLAVSRVQTRDSATARGLDVMSAVPGGSPVVHMPEVVIAEGRSDVLTITNPSRDQTALVDIEILAESEVPLGPIELTIHPRRTVVVRLADEARLMDLESFSIVVRSLSGVPVAASLESIVSPGGEAVTGSAATSGVDVASLQWLVPIEAIDTGVAEVIVVNPSSVAVARVRIIVVGSNDTAEISTVELGPSRRTSVSTVDLGGDQAVVRIVASAPVVVASETSGFTSRSMAAAVRSAEAVQFSDVP